MKVVRICPENEETMIYSKCACIECVSHGRHRKSDFVLTIANHASPLCKECAWDIADMLNDTAMTSFIKAEK